MNNYSKSLEEDSLKFRELVFSKLDEKREKAKKLMTMKEAAQLSHLNFDSSLNFSPFLTNESKEIFDESGHIITSVDYRGNKERELQKKTGFIRSGIGYKAESATQRMMLKLASKRRQRTIAAKGQGFRRRIARHMKLAWKRRKQFGI